MKYYYETHTSIFPTVVEADTDDSAMEMVKSQEGQYLIGVHTIYTKDLNDNRVIWME